MTKALLLALAVLNPVLALATPSGQVWIPSTDIQKHKTIHLNFDTYLRTRREPDGSRKAPMSMLGPTVGVLPWEKLQGEVGFDLIYSGDQVPDNSPFYFHGKLGTPENSLLAGSPSLAVGGYNFGTKSGVTNQDIVYGLAARTLPVVGRLTAGYYVGNRAVLVDQHGNTADNGLLLAWDRTMKELSEKLWLAMDYQGGKSAVGQTGFCAGWWFTPSTLVIVGYNIFNDRTVAGQNTLSFQVDINF
ncbi:MAG TPA: hypothetical protein DCM05_12960 [Elusimicrobia bacterium]|nr:hypothetical protein [Elusimicrobiota bacterium]